MQNSIERDLIQKHLTDMNELNACITGELSRLCKLTCGGGKSQVNKLSHELFFTQRKYYL